LDRKHIRRNYYKNSAAKKHNKIITRLVFSIKTAGVIAALLLLSFVFIFSYDFLTQCDYFKAEKLVVTGMDRLSEKQVLEQAQIKKGIRRQQRSSDWNSYQNKRTPAACRSRPGPQIFNQ
jgi:cell division septal protein FtsQ